MAVRCQAFSNRLLLLVREIGLNNRMFAKSIGISENAATNYLKKGRLPEPDILVKISNRLGKSVDYLLQDVKADEASQNRCENGGDAMNFSQRSCSVTSETITHDISYPKISILREDPLIINGEAVSSDEKRIIRLYRKLDSGNRQSANDYLTDLLLGQKEGGEGTLK